MINPGTENYIATFQCGCGHTLKLTKAGTLPKHYIPKGPFTRRAHPRSVCPRSYQFPRPDSQVMGKQITESKGERT